MNDDRSIHDRMPSASQMRRVVVVGKRGESSFAIKSLAKVIAFQITDHVTRQTAVVSEIVGQVAEESAHELQRDITENRLRVEPNSREYAAWKARTGKATHPLESTGEYADSIKATESRPGLWHVGIDPDAVHPSGIPAAILGRILEQGTLDGIPARPHFAPASRRARARVAAKFAQYKTDCHKKSAQYKNRKPRLLP